MTDHPSCDELSALLRGDMSDKRQREILRHLLSPCYNCLAAAPPPLAIMLGYEPTQLDTTNEEGAAYQEVVNRVFGVVREHARALERQMTQEERIGKILAKDGLEGLRKLPKQISDPAKIEAFLTKSWSLRHEDPKQMLRFAWLASLCAKRLNPQKYGAARVYDLQCRAQAELGNAQRVLDQFEACETSLIRARQLFELGTRNDFLDIRLLELEASLEADLRRFGRACLKLEKVYRFYKRCGDDHLAGRALLKQGLFTGNAGNSDEALRLLKKSLNFIDPRRDPSLVYAAMHNQVWILLEAGRYQEAEKQLFHLRSVQQHAGGQINQFRIRWEEGRIDTGLGRYKRAEATLDEIRAAFLEVNRAYDSALASLDLTAALLAQKKAGKAIEVVSEAYRTFMALDIQREGLIAVSLLKTACEVREATKEMAEEVARFLRRFANDPKARFKGRSWEQV